MGSSFATLRTIPNGPYDGNNYGLGELAVVGDTLYGMTSYTNGALGTIFKIKPDGSGYAELHSFVGGAGDGGFPSGALTPAAGALFGTTLESGSFGSQGAVFRINPDGTGFTQLHLFLGGPADGARPTGSLVLVGDKLVGMTGAGGAAGTKAQSFK